MRMLDLFCGRFGWGKAFAARGWEVVGIDLVEPADIPEGCTFIKADILQIIAEKGRFSIYEYDAGPGTGKELWTFQPDFVCASSPCENFSIHGMKHFHPNPAYPEMGLKLFNHTKTICEASSTHYVMENVRAAQKFVGDAKNHCGSFYLWGNAVPPLMPQGVKKGLMTTWIDSKGKLRHQGPQGRAGRPKGEGTVEASKRRIAIAAEIPSELANCIADYAEGIYAS